MRRSGATPPKVKAYCSNEGTISTTSMRHPRKAQVRGAMPSRTQPGLVRALGPPGGTEQLHRAGDLLRQDVGGPLHAALAAGHQPVQIRPADQAAAGAERNGRDDPPP